MKHLDIEQLERKNIYKTPDHFFEKIQENVMKDFSENQNQQKPQIGRKSYGSWWYAAASLVLLAGAAWVFSSIPSEEANNIVRNNDVQEAINPPTQIQNTPKPETENYIALANDLTIAAEAHQKEKQPATKIKEIPDQRAEITFTGAQQIEQILDVLTAEEIASLAQNTEQDIYLDLYN